MSKVLSFAKKALPYVAGACGVGIAVLAVVGKVNPTAAVALIAALGLPSPVEKLLDSLAAKKS